MSDNNLTDIQYQKRRDNYQPNVLTMSRQEWGLNERKIVSFIINQIDHKADYHGQNLIIRIPLAEMSKHMKHEEIKKAALALKKKEIGYENSGSEEFEYITPFPRISYKNKVLEVVIFNEVLPIFIELGKRYTRYNLEVFLSFNSVYTQRIYELLMMEYRQGKGRKVFKVSIETLQSVLGCNYRDFYDLRQRVLLPTQKEIYEKADLIFDYEVSKKQGKKAIELTFKIQSFVDIAIQNVQEEIKGFEVAKPDNVYFVARQLLETKYTFKEKQVSYILNNKDILKLFVEINSKIENGLIKIKTSTTKYMAVVLGLNNIIL